MPSVVTPRLAAEEDQCKDNNSLKESYKKNGKGTLDYLIYPISEDITLATRPLQGKKLSHLISRMEECSKKQGH